MFDEQGLLDIIPLQSVLLQWINEKAIPSMAARPLAQAANTLGEPALSAYFEDPTVQFTLSSKVGFVVGCGLATLANNS